MAKVYFIYKRAVVIMLFKWRVSWVTSTVPLILNIFRKRKETQSEQIVMKDSSGQASNIDIFKALKSVE